MASFGEKLRRERENRNTTIEEISDATGIGLSYLEALEHNEFEALPGRAFGKLYIRAYAKVLEFDPGPLLSDYDRELQIRKVNEPPGGHPSRPIMVRPEMPARPAQEEPPEDEREEPPEEPHEIPIEAESTEEVDEAPVEVLQEESAEAPPQEPTEPPVEEPIHEEPESPEETEQAPALVELPAKTEVPSPAYEETVEAPEGTQDRRRLALLAALIGVPLLIVIVWILFGVLGGDDRGDLSETATPPASSTPQHEPSGGPAAGEVQPEATERPTEPAVETDVEPSPVDAGAATGGLVVDEFGVGRKVVNHRLEDRDDRFQEGEVVWFLTRLLGGTRGERIRHVWLHEGAPVQSIDLVIGGSHHEGAPVQSIDLVIGGSHWRTQSNKTLWGVGSWTVEVRDREDRVLARATFTCVPR